MERHRSTKAEKQYVKGIIRNLSLTKMVRPGNNRLSSQREEHENKQTECYI